jgi:RNA polymerase sigma-70 factor (ECF subfamily)
VSRPAPTESERPATADELGLHTAIRTNSAEWQQRAFDEFHSLVHGLLIKSLGPNAEIADLVSEVFLTFFENAHRIKSAGGVRSYLVSITMNEARRETRRRRRREFFHKLSGALSDYEQKASPDDPKAKAALIHLNRILNELSAEYRIAFVLHSLEGMQVAEIAEALNVSYSTAKRRVQRANRHVLKRVSRNALLADYIRERTGGKSA